MSATRFIVLGLGLALGGGCGPSGGQGDDGAGGGSADAAGSAIDGGGSIDASCGAQSESIGLVNLGDPPDLLIVLDRSGSMQSPVSIFPPNLATKWSIMRGALEDLAAARDQNLRLGLLEFPSDDNCGGNAAAEVPIALGQHVAIEDYFADRSPGGNTPAHIALTAARAYYDTVPVNPEGRYVLFATDGLPNCAGGPPDPEVASDAETVAAVTALAGDGISTYVLGFGSFLGLDTSVLDDAAQAGGVPRPGGPPYYYDASDASELAAVLDEIAGGLIVPSCSFALDAAPPDPDLVTVTLDGVAVPRSPSHQDGWDYHPDAMTITFFGSYCAQIEGSRETAVSFAYGCPGPLVE